MTSLGKSLAARKRAGKASVIAYMMGGSVPQDRFLAITDALVSAGIAGLEVGFPFSDPMAEGAVIQRAASDALERKTRFEDVLGLIKAVSPKVPTALMTYLNPLIQRGPPRVMSDLEGAGASALIVPDLPVDSVSLFKIEGKSTGVDTVLLASPATGHERLGRIVRSTRGFLYLVSRFGTTGVGAGKAVNPSSSSPDLSGIITAANEMRPALPVMVGFGVSTPRSVSIHLTCGADGVIVGSMLQNMVTGGTPPNEVGEAARLLVAAAEEFKHH